MENKSPWVKASEVQIDRERKIYFAKVDYINIFTKEPAFIKGSGSFSSQGTFFWREPGYIPISANKYDELYLLDESLITTLQSELAELKGQNEALTKRYIRIENRKQEQRKVIKDLLVKAGNLQSENARLQSEVEQLKKGVVGIIEYYDNVPDCSPTKMANMANSIINPPFSI